MANTFDIPYLSGMPLRGPDALRFCQSQFTFDANLLSGGQWQVGAWCDVKGRCLLVILARRHEDGVDLVFPLSQSSLIDRLKMYSIGHRLQFGELMPLRGCYGSPTAGAVIPGGDVRSMELATEKSAHDSNAIRRWRHADMTMPLPWLQANTAGKYLPQFLGLEANQGLSYRKGCYPGQEIIARVHYLGSVKRHLLGFKLAGTATNEPEPGAKLRNSNDEEAGEVLDSMTTARGVIGLAVCSVAIQSGSCLSLGTDAEGQTLMMTRVQSL